MEGAPKSRPIGVTIIAILNIIEGAFMIVFGIGLITLWEFETGIPYEKNWMELLATQ